MRREILTNRPSGQVDDIVRRRRAEAVYLHDHGEAPSRRGARKARRFSLRADALRSTPTFLHPLRASGPRRTRTADGWGCLAYIPLNKERGHVSAPLGLLDGIDGGRRWRRSLHAASVEGGRHLGRVPSRQADITTCTRIMTSVCRVRYHALVRPIPGHRGLT